MVYVGSPCYILTQDSSYLAHHGILGQKWGIRRYQNKDGTLTDAGKRRLAKITAKEAQYAEQKRRLLGKKTEQDENNQKESSAAVKKPKNPHLGKSVFSMSDAELRSEINRLNLEKQYRQYMSELYPSEKKKKKRGKEMVNNVIKPALENVGKNVVENAAGMGVNKIGDMLGLEYQLYTKSKKKSNSGD